MVLGTTSVGVKPEVRDALAEYRDRNGYPHYNAALEALLNETEHDGV